MKAEVPFAASIYLIVILLAISFVGRAQTAIGNENPAALQSQEDRGTAESLSATTFVWTLAPHR
jgi:hypothetical protein